MDKIKKIWFKNSRLFMADEQGKEHSRPLQAFPRLLMATDRQRADFRISRWEDSVRWEAIDEDIHISSFQDTDEPNYDNEVFCLLKNATPTEMQRISAHLGIDSSLLYRYFYGMLQASPETVSAINLATKDIAKHNFRRIAAVF